MCLYPTNCLVNGRPVRVHVYKRSKRWSRINCVNFTGYLIVGCICCVKITFGRENRKLRISNWRKTRTMARRIRLDKCAAKLHCENRFIGSTKRETRAIFFPVGTDQWQYARSAANSKNDVGTLGHTGQNYNKNTHRTAIVSGGF